MRRERELHLAAGGEGRGFSWSRMQGGTRGMCDDYDEQLKRQVAGEEGGTWREQLRKDSAPWFEGLYLGFQCGDGWRDLIVALTAAIPGVLGGPAGTQGHLDVKVKEKFGGPR